MKRRDRNRAVAALTLGALVAFQGAARADDAAEEIRLIKAQLKKLEEKVNDQARKQKETQVQIHNVAVRPQGFPAEQASIQGRPTPGSPYGGLQGVGIAPLGGTPLPPGGYSAEGASIQGRPMPGAPSIYINGVTITPGGFLAAESVFRSRNIGADITTPFANIPYNNVRTGNANEYRMSARASRVSLLVQGDVNPTTHLSGWMDLDFLGAAQTANSNESNSFTPRIRNIYLTMDQDDFGFHVLAGQNWSLLTANTRGIMPRTENTPLTIDTQFVPGFNWARQPQIRVVKDFDKTLWFAVSAENPQTNTFVGPGAQAGPFVGGVPTVGSTAALPGTLVNTFVPPGSSLFNSGNSISLNHMPDIIGKVAWDPTFGDRHIHVEAYGLFRDFYNQVNGSNQDVAAGSYGGTILVPIIPQNLEFQFTGMNGRGIGRYATGSLPDVSVNANGSLSPIQETTLLAGLIWRPQPGLDIYTYAGEEIQQASFSNSISASGAVSAFGDGNPLYTNAGCSNVLSTACVGNTHLIRSITAGFWDTIYSGPFGQFRAGLQYAYVQKFSFQGFGGGAKAEENSVFTSLRYYPFQSN
ncbi:MAG: hypothetical protein WDN46_00090 [Methylocella sp.]